MTSTETQTQILDAVMSVIVRDGVRGASMRSVAKEADVSLGLLSYHFDDKKSLIEAAFRRATDALLDASIEAGEAGAEPADQVREYIRGAFTDEFLDEDYLALRISLWAVARTDPTIGAVERDLYQRYADNLARFLAAARPDLSQAEVDARTTDVIVTQNGLWLNWARSGDAAALERGLARCESIAFA